ncbi:MAG: antibiotic biosynthesis monooxygenase [Pseudomonadota bacterium]|jgi:heme-degrading monooxygenase HmoA
MPYLLVRHKVSDLAKWRPLFEEHAAVRKEFGFTGARAFKNADDPHELLVLFEFKDLDKARLFTRSDELREAMERAGVSDVPDMFFLEEDIKTPA